MSDARVRRIVIGGRRFAFLGFSSSQLREHGAWLYSAPPGGPSAGDLRARLGDFTSIPVVAKCAARLGQCFSATVATVTPSCHAGVGGGSGDWVDAEVPDVTTADGRYTFSDGVGRVSPQAAAEIFEAARRRPPLSPGGAADTAGGAARAPSAFQIRYKGCKGVLAVDARLPERQALTRPSMRKFDVLPSSAASTTSNGADELLSSIEVCSHARRTPAFLNRQLVTLLSTLGVDDASFEALLQSQLRLLDAALVDASAAASLLRSTSAIDASLSRDVVALLRAGVGLRDPFVRGMVAVARASQLGDLRARARVLVPNAAVLVGVMDETGALRYGEVFSRCSGGGGGGAEAAGDDVASLPPCLSGLVVVAKNPCLHPGDVRVLRAVGADELAARASSERGAAAALDVTLYFDALADVLVFPFTGPTAAPQRVQRQRPGRRRLLRVVGPFRCCRRQRAATCPPWTTRRLPPSWRTGCLFPSTTSQPSSRITSEPTTSEWSHTRTWPTPTPARSAPAATSACGWRRCTPRPSTLQKPGCVSFACVNPRPASAALTTCVVSGHRLRR